MPCRHASEPVASACLLSAAMCGLRGRPVCLEAAVVRFYEGVNVDTLLIIRTSGRRPVLEQGAGFRELLLNMISSNIVLFPSSLFGNLYIGSS